MRILIASESYWPNKDGGAVFEHRLVHQLLDSGHHVSIMAPGQDNKVRREQDGKSTIYRTSSVRLINGHRVTYRARKQVKRVLEIEKPDIVHVHTMGILGSALVREAKKRRIAVVGTNHLMPENILANLPILRVNKLMTVLIWRMIARFHNNFSEVTSPTPTAVAFLEKYGISTKVTAITNGIDSGYFRVKRGVGTSRDKTLMKFNIPADNYIVYLGRVSAEKNLEMLIRSYALLPDELRARNSLVIAGKGSHLKTLKRLAHGLGIGVDVVFTGLVSDKEKLALLQNALMYVMPSPSELQSISMMEAMACGLPVLAVDVAALAELCKDGQNGYLIELNNFQQLADKMQELISDKKLAKSLGEVSRSVVVRGHSHESSLNEYLDLYRRNLMPHTLYLEYILRGLESKPLKIGGVDIAIYEGGRMLGNTKTILILHGLGGDHFGLVPLASELSADFRVVIMELPAHGKSGFLSGPDIDEYRDVYEMVIRKLLKRYGKIDATVAHSFACSLPRKSEDLTKIIFINPVPSVGILTRVYGKFIGLNTRLFAATYYSTPVVFARRKLLTRDQSEYSYDRIKWVDEVSRNSVEQIKYHVSLSNSLYRKSAALIDPQLDPLLIIASSRDVVPAKSDVGLTGLGKRFGDKTKIRIVDGGHLVLIEDPKRISDIIRAELL